jgi:hypothetical protein
MIFRSSTFLDCEKIQKFYQTYFEKDPTTLVQPLSFADIVSTAEKGNFFLCVDEKDEIIASMRIETDVKRILNMTNGMKPTVHQNITSTGNVETLNKNFDIAKLETMITRRNTFCCYGGSSLVLDEARNSGLLHRMTTEHARHFINSLIKNSLKPQYIFGAFGVVKDEKMNQLWKIHMTQISVLLNSLYPEENLEIYVFENKDRLFTFFGNSGNPLIISHL